MSQGQEHHIAFPRRLWVAQETTKRIRNTRLLRPVIEADAHRELHRHVGIVAVPGFIMAERVLREFHPRRDDVLATMDELCHALEAASRHASFGAVERGLAQLSIQAIELQRPYVEQGLIRPAIR